MTETENSKESEQWKNDSNPFNAPHATPLSVLHNICHKRKINVEFTVLSVEENPSKPPEQIFAILLTLKGEDFEQNAIGKGRCKKDAKQQAAVKLLELCGFDMKEMVQEDKQNRCNTTATVIEKDLSNGINAEDHDKEREYFGKKLREHMNNLEIVEAALKINPSHLELKKIMSDLLELIRLVSQRILQRKNDKNINGSGVPSPNKSGTETNKNQLTQPTSSLSSMQNYQVPSKRKIPDDPLNSSNAGIKKPANSVPVISNLRIIRR